MWGWRVCVMLVGLLSAPGIHADPLPKGFAEHKFNPPGQGPATRDGVTTFHLAPGVCSTKDYGDGRGENDCKNGNLRSAMVYPQKASVGDVIEYRFDIRVDPSLSYTGFRSMSAFGFYPEGLDSALRIASWEGPFVHNFIYMLKVSAAHGIDFLARQCQSPADFGEWVTFSMKTLWSRDQKGWVKVSCNDRVIYADEGVATNQAPFCWESNECDPAVPRDPDKLLFILGPVLQGFGPDWQKIPAAKSIFAEIQDEGITIQIRNASVTSGAVLYEEADKAVISRLQARLTDLGCDPGPIDGVSGKKTREAALTCRTFPEGTLPAKLTVLTAPQFLDAYSGSEVAALPRGEAITGGDDGLVPVTYEVHPAEEGAFKAGRDVEVNSNILARVKGWKKSQTLFFGMVGQFNYTISSFIELELFLEDSLGKEAPIALNRCGRFSVVYPDGTVHASIRLSGGGGNRYLAPKNLDCALAALPPVQAKKLAFIVDHFSDIAVGMVRDKTIEKMRHEGLKIFFRRVAKGEVTISRTE